MGFLRKLAVAGGGASGTPPPTSSWWYTSAEGFVLEAAGASVAPELALTLSYVHCAVSTISDDLGTMSCQMFRGLDGDERSRVRYNEAPWGPLAYRLRWRPNQIQSAKAFWSTLAWQYALRPRATAEIVRRPGRSLIDQVIPRHPDRVHEERLPSGRLRYQLIEPDGTTRPVLQDDMLVIRNTSTDGLNAIGRTRFGGRTLSAALSMQEFTRNYFQHGATASLIGTYKGDKDDEDEAALHRSITRYLSGAENAGGLLLVKEDIDIKALGLEPEKAQLLGLKEYSGRDIARLFKMPPHKLGISGTQTYASQVQSAQEYVTGCLMPIVVEFEQAVQFALLDDTDVFVKFNMDYLLRADLKTRMEAYAIGIRSRILRPSDARVREDMNPDPRLDELSEGDYRAGSRESRSSGRASGGRAASRAGRLQLRGVLLLHDAAVRCVRRERAAVERLAKKHPSDVAKWRDELRAFYEDQAHFIADTMRMPIEVARHYAAQHGSLIEASGVIAMSDHWERHEAEELAALALEPIGVAA